ncbi:unnamed protein product [Alopecurus aequalis]
MENAVVDDGKNRHGFPQGYRFVPHDDELMRLLDLQLDRRRLPHPLPNIFRDNVKICDSHPADLYEEHKEHAEAGYIYFFGHREYPTRGRRPKRKLAARDGGFWKASGGSKELRRRGVLVGLKLTMVFYHSKEEKTDWAMHEYTRIEGNPSDRKVKSLALYRLYKKPSRGADQAIVAASTPPQAHHHEHQDAHGVAAGPSNWETPAAGVNPHTGGCMRHTGSPTPPPRQEAVNHFEYATGFAGWDNMPPLSLPSPVSAVAHDLPAEWGQSGCPEPTDYNNQPPPPPLPLPAPSPAEEGYLAVADEFNVWCETTTQEQDELPAASPCSWLPMPYDDLPMLMDESELYSSTLEELLLAPIMQDGLLPDLLPMPDTNQDNTAAPATMSMPDKPTPAIRFDLQRQEQSTSGS